MRIALFLLIVFAFSSLSGLAQEDDEAKDRPAGPATGITDGKYGPRPRIVSDLWKPKSKTPTPLVVYIHDGGFVNGDKSKLSANLLKQLLDNGIAVVAIHYSLLPDHVYPQAYIDCTRAVQFARYNARAWNIANHAQRSDSSSLFRCRPEREDGQAEDRVQTEAQGRR